MRASTSLNNVSTSVTAATAILQEALIATTTPVNIMDTVFRFKVVTNKTLNINSRINSRVNNSHQKWC